MQPGYSPEIIFEDDALLAINKPAGMLVIPDGYDKGKANLQRLLEQSLGRLWVVHRLDLDTSGVLLFARSADAHRHLNAQFEHHTIRKTYHLLTWGPADWDSRRVNLPLRVNGDRNHRTVVDFQHGKPAHTDFTVLDRFPDQISLIAAAPTTGYTHQIRAHCAALGLWLVNDPLYFPRPFPPPVDFQPLHHPDLVQHVRFLPISRTGLHAQQITFSHPLSELPMNLQASYPQDFAQSLKLLRFH